MRHVQTTFVDPFTLWGAPGWSAAYFAGPASVALRAASAGRSIRDSGGRVLEGWRASSMFGTDAYDPRAAATAVYSQANIGRLRLLPGSEHWASPQTSDPACVRPDDVVLNKLAPVRAAYVSPNARRHPVDGNTFIVRGLTQPTAAWAAVCLNEPAYEELLLVDAGVLRRVRSSALAGLRLPVAPPEMEGLSARLRDLIDEALMTSEGLVRVQDEANSFASIEGMLTGDLSNGVFFPCAAIATENWLPDATSLHAEQALLGDEHGWVRLSDIATFGDRSRLAHAPDSARSVRLSDVSDDLLVAASPTGPLQPRRTLASQLLPGDVLLSTLATAFRSAYIDDGIPAGSHATDGWVAVRFHETPAAWAFLLSTPAIRGQVARLAVGSVQQFVSPESLQSVRLPVPSRAIRERWQRAVERHHAERRSIDRRWSVLTSELATAFDDAHRPFAETRPRAKEVVR